MVQCRSQASDNHLCEFVGGQAATLGRYDYASLCFHAFRVVRVMIRIWITEVFLPRFFLVSRSRKGCLGPPRLSSRATPPRDEGTTKPPTMTSIPVVLVR